MSETSSAHDQPDTTFSESAEFARVLSGLSATALVGVPERRWSPASAVLGFVAASAIVGLLVAVGVTPAIAMAGAWTTTSVNVFQELPGYIHVGRMPQRNRIFANGPHGPVQIATVYDENREEVTWSQVSKYLKDAAVDGEDKDYYSHGAVDLQSIVRAAIGNAAAGSVQSGASTIPMQVVRNVEIQEALKLPTAAEQQAAYRAATQPTVGRKLKEVKLAVSLEKSYTKKQILLAYLNIANFGRANYGVQAAAQAYFSTTADKVTPAQAASIIAIVQSPSYRNLASPKLYAANQARRDFILRRMYASHDLSKAQYDAAINTPVDSKFVHLSVVQDSCLGAKVAYRWMCDYVVNDVKNLALLGATKQQRLANWKLGGYDIYTTMNTSMQDVATSTLRRFVPRSEPRFKLGGAVSTVQPGTGRILIMAENKDFNNTLKGAGRGSTAVNFNVDEDNGGSVGFQPGSAYKLFTLLAWLEAGHGLGDVLNASVRSVPMSSFKDSCTKGLGGAPYTFMNDENEQGPTTVMHATARSINSVFVQMAEQVNLCAIKKVAEKLGIHNGNGSPLSTLPSCVIGGCDNTIAPLTLAAAYAAIADKGKFCEPVAVEKVIGPDGTNLGAEDAHCTQAIPAKIANTAAAALAGVMSGGGTAGSANPFDGTPFLGKTGTTNNSLQTWTVASSTKASSAVWVGNISGNQPLRSIAVAGFQAALLRHVVFRTVMAYVDSKLGRGAAFPPPDPKLVGGSTSYYTGPTPHKNKPKPGPKPTGPPQPAPTPGG